MVNIKQSATNLPQSLILTFRIVWVALLIVLATAFIGGIAPRFEKLSALCQVEPCEILTLALEEAEALASLGLTTANYAAFQIVIDASIGLICVLLAFLVFWRRFDDRMGILLAFMLLLFGLNFIVETDKAFYDLYPNLMPIQGTITSLATIPLLMIIFLFPDGRLVPKWSRYILLVVSLTAIMDPFLLRPLSVSASGEFSIILTFTILFAVLIGVASQIYRYRFISKASQKQQTKWVLFGFLALLVPILGWTIFFEILTLPPGLPRLIVNTLVYGVMAIFLFFFPLSFVIAIMRFRLWDIDLLIRRTLVYSILTGALILVYFGSVVVVQTAVNSITGQQQSSQLTIALSTLLIAALFNPLRRRVQTFIDRRFYRHKYDANQVLAQFAHAAQDEVDMDQLSAVLLKTVEKTMQPEKISLWLKSDSL